MIYQECYNRLRNGIVYILFYDIEIWCYEAFDHLCLGLFTEFCIFTYFYYCWNAWKTITRQCIMFTKRCIKSVKLVTFLRSSLLRNWLFLNHLYFLLILIIHIFQPPIHNLWLINKPFLNLRFLLVKSKNRLWGSFRFIRLPLLFRIKT